MQEITGHALGGYMCAMLGAWADVAVQVSFVLLLFRSIEILRTI